MDLIECGNDVHRKHVIQCTMAYLFNQPIIGKIMYKHIIIKLRSNLNKKIAFT